MFRGRSPFFFISLCIAMGALPAVVAATLSHITAREFALSVLSGTIYATCISIPCWIVFDRAGCWLHGNRSVLQKHVFMFAVLAGFAIAGCFVANLILMAIGILPFSRLGPAFFWSLRICLLITFSAGALTTVIMALQGKLQSTREQLQERELAVERERKTAAEARYASLESRVRPHFLFNTLNSISALVREDPAEAERTIERLAALLRYSLDTELAGLVNLSEELRIVRDYLEIERVRFAARLRYSIHADDAAIGRPVPALSIQTLVENSVKYAVGASTEGATISIRAGVENGALRIEVLDDGPGFDETEQRKPGHGLDLLRQRLDGLFGSKASLTVNAVPGRTLVTIGITQ